MSEANHPATLESPSQRQILRATGIAILIAAIICVTIVLPAEYGIDPLHTGAALGLLSLSKATANAAPAATAVSAAEAPAEIQAPVIKGVFVSQPGSYKVDSRELTLGPGEGIEIKYHMQKGSGMVYSWTANRNVEYEFHGEPDVKPAGAGEDYFESYEKDDAQGKKESHGTFTAPSTGIQGWFWDNESPSPVTIKLVTAGFYDYILQNKDDVKTRLQPTDPK
ncbi:MAG TPA: hypothetical protein VFB23_00725 [Candidatus Acidoferrales bacterium]|nr:hypothetical protein [Candidatus Acidoferrales bacterium]